MAKPRPAWFPGVTRRKFGLAAKKPPGAPAITAERYQWVLDAWAAFERWDAWKNRGGPRPKGVWKKVPTDWGSVGEATFSPWVIRAERRRKAPVTPVPATPTSPRQATAVELEARDIIFLTSAPMVAAGATPWHRHAPVADPGYSSHYGDAFWSFARTRPGMIPPWCDCRPWGHDNPLGIPHGTPFAEALMMARSLGLAEPIGQGESEWELRHATGIDLDGSILSGAALAEARRCPSEPWALQLARKVVGNPHTWTAAQRATFTALTHVGAAALILETYSNASGKWPDSYDSAGVPVASYCIALYDATGERQGRGAPLVGTPAPPDPTAAEYRAHTPPDRWPDVCSYDALNGRRSGDWREFPQP